MGEPTGIGHGQSPSPQLQLQQVSVVVNPSNRYLLQDISFDVEVGDRIGIVGASGAGKTTLLRLLNRLNASTSGSILYQGKTLEQHPVRQLRQQIMLVPQEPKLLGMTVKEALAYPLVLQNLSQESIQERLKSWSQRFGIPNDWLDRTELQLSVGQRQWVSLARACIVEPTVMLLDEPSSALDPGRIAQLVEILNPAPWTLMIASHQIHLLKQLCNRLLWLEAGLVRQDCLTAMVDWQEIRATLEQQAQSEEESWG